MLKETTLMVQTCDLKVDINCHGCVKKVTKILNKIDGVYQTNVDRSQGKVTITGVMDMDTVFKKLKKGSMSAKLWDANLAVVSKHQNPQLGSSARDDQLKDAGVKDLPQGEASSNGGSGARSSGGTNDATIVLPQLTPTPEQNLPNIQQQIEQRLRMVQPQPTPTPEQHLPNIQQQIEQRLRMLNGDEKKLPPQQPMGTPPPTINRDAAGIQVKDDTIGQQLHNGSALGNLKKNKHGQAKKDIGVGVGSQMMGGSMVPPKGGMMRPTNNLTGPSSFLMGSMSKGPYNQLDGYNMQPYGGGAIHGLGMPAANGMLGNGFYPSGAGRSGMEMMQQVARNPMPQQPYMMVQPQQEHEKMMNAHFPHSQNGHYGTGSTGYQLMGYDNGHGLLQQQYPPPMYYPMPPPPPQDNFFSDENPNICSLM